VVIRKSTPRRARIGVTGVTDAPSGHCHHCVSAGSQQQSAVQASEEGARPGENPEILVEATAWDSHVGRRSGRACYPGNSPPLSKCSYAYGRNILQGKR